MSSTDVWLTHDFSFLGGFHFYWLGSQARRGRWRYGCTVPGPAASTSSESAVPSNEHWHAGSHPSILTPITDLRTSAISTANQHSNLRISASWSDPARQRRVLPKSPRRRPESPTIYSFQWPTTEVAHAIARAAAAAGLSSDNWTIFGSDRALLWGRLPPCHVAGAPDPLRCQLWQGPDRRSCHSS